MSQIFLLRSADRTSNSASSSQFTLQLTGSICPMSGVYQVEYITMFNTFYSIQSGLNDRIYWNDGSTNRSTQIPAGFYSTSGSNNIATTIGTVMTAASSASATITASFSITTGLLTITSNQNFTLTFGTNTS